MNSNIESIQNKLDRAAAADTSIYEDYLSSDIRVAESLAVEARIGRHAQTVVFNDCPFLTTINIPEGVTLVDLSFCTKLEAIELPSTCEKFIFDGCTSLRNIHVPNGLPNGALGSVRNCRSLVELDPILIDRITSFGGCPLLEGLPTYLPAVSDSRSIGAYSHVPSITEMTIDLSKDGFITRTAVEIGDTSEFFPITSMYRITGNLPDDRIAPDLFNSCISLKSVHVVPPEPSASGHPIGVGYRAFKSCTDLTSIDLQHSIVAVDSQAFEGCTSLSDIAMQQPLEPGMIVGYRAFACCINYDPVEFVRNCAQIGSEAFSYCVSLEVADLSNLWPENHTDSTGSVPGDRGAHTLASGVFEHCISLKTVNFNNRLYYIGKRAFYHCTKLDSVTVPAFLSSGDEPVTIDDEAFKYCISLKDFSLESGEIGDRVFEGCQNLTSVSLGAPEVVAIGEYAFSRAVKLGAVTVDTEAVQLSEGSFNNCYSLKSIKTESGESPTVRIAENCFKNCVSFSTDQLHESAVHAFYRCVSMTEARTTDRLALGVYKDCNNLERIDVVLTPPEATAEPQSTEATEDGENPPEPEVILAPVPVGESALEMCSSLTDLLEGADAYLVPDGTAFSGCVSLEKLPKVYYNPKFIPEEPTPEQSDELDKYSKVFDGCYKLKELDLMLGSGKYAVEQPDGSMDDVVFPTSTAMFGGCYALTSLQTDGEGKLVVDESLSDLSLLDNLDIPNFEVVEDSSEQPDYEALDAAINDLAMLRCSSYTRVDDHYMLDTIKSFSERSSF